MEGFVLAKGKKSGGRDFEKGNKYGKGQPPLPPEIREIKKFTRSQIIEKMADLLGKSRAEIEALVKEPKTPLLDLMLASAARKAITEGDPRHLSFFLDRLIGKVTQPISFENELKKASNEQIAEAGQKALQIIQLHGGGQNGKALPGG